MKLSSKFSVLLGVLAISSCNNDEPLPKFPSEMLGVLEHISIHTSPSNSLEDISFEFIDSEGERVLVEVSPTTGTFMTPNAEITYLSDTDIFLDDTVIEKWKSSDGTTHAEILEAGPVKSLSVIITFYEGAKMLHYNQKKGAYGTLEKLDAPKEIRIDAGGTVFVNYTPHGGLSPSLSAPFLDRSKFKEAILGGLTELIDSNPNASGLQRAPVSIYLPFFDPYESKD